MLWEMVRFWILKKTFYKSCSVVSNSAEENEHCHPETIFLRLAQKFGPSFKSVPILPRTAYSLAWRLEQTTWLCWILVSLWIPGILVPRQMALCHHWSVSITPIKIWDSWAQENCLEYSYLLSLARGSKQLLYGSSRIGLEVYVWIPVCTMYLVLLLILLFIFLL